MGDLEPQELKGLLLRAQEDKGAEGLVSGTWVWEFSATSPVVLCYGGRDFEGLCQEIEAQTSQSAPLC